jgi:hypothetical protein
VRNEKEVMTQEKKEKGKQRFPAKESSKQKRKIQYSYMAAKIPYKRPYTHFPFIICECQ